MRRREFINKIGVGAAATMIPSTMVSFVPSISSDKNSKNLKFGIVTDVHKDLMPDADERLDTFIQQAIKRDVDFIIQMGDFCFGESKNKGFLNIWEQYKGPKYHVLGNHDMDMDSKEEIMDFWGMPKTYYSYDKGGYHFVVLDANFLYQDNKFIDYKNANFYVDSSIRTFIHDEQIEWFQADLESTRLPTIVFCHQSLWHGVNNREKLQKIMESYSDKVICSLNGHHHTDYHFKQQGVDYIGINSMSYQWVQKYTSNDRFPKDLYNQYPNLPHIAGYEDSLYAFATIKPKGILEIEGVKSNWMSPSPYDLGKPKEKGASSYVPQISNYKIKN